MVLERGWPGKHTLTEGLASRSVMRKADGSPADGDGLREQLAGATASPSSALPDSVRPQLEQALGADLSGVRVHTGAESSDAARALGAQAFALGQHVHFGMGRFDPDSNPGRALLAHEVAHTVQQRGASGDVTQEKLEVSSPGDAHEVEADSFAESFVRGEATGVNLISPGSVSRQLVSRHPDPPPAGGSFRPTLAPGLPTNVELNKEFRLRVGVSNSAQAPSGTTLSWSLLNSDGRVQPTSTDIYPDAAVLKGKPKEVGPTSVIAKASGGGSETSTPPISFVVPDVDVVWGTDIRPGNTGAGRDRELTGGVSKIYRNDTIVLSAELSHVTEPQRILTQNSVTTVTSGHGSPPVSEGSWQGNTIQWEIKAAQPGPLDLDIDINVPGMASPLNYQTSFRVVMDLTDLLATVQTAHLLIDQKWHQGAQKLEAASTAFETALKEHRAAIKDASAAGELVGELLMGVFFAALGGAAGGAVGNIIKGKLGKAVADSASGGAYTDAGKDVAKFATRALSRLSGGSGSDGAGATSETPGGTAGAASGGGESGAGQDPVMWARGISSKLHGEAAKMLGKLAAVTDAARNADRMTEFEDFEGDPVAAIQADETVTALADVSTNKTDYSRELWHEWLRKYAHSVTKTHYGGREGGSTRASVANHVNGKLRDHINAAAQQCGESGDDWIRVYGGVSERKAQDEANEYNRTAW
ncbi:MAG: DUF4157 domain-containing protein [Deltaproteobacteria bacterium]|nr:DUF4157 domain-containing protein [Deltaproteobacteria bacterium]